jgi:uncharacterized protein (DUF1810 family)
MSLERFLEAQDEARLGKSVFATAVDELDAGRKRTHWIWFIFPQVPLGQSETARRYAIRGREEAIAYLAHPVLESRLRRVLEITVRQLVDRNIDPEALFDGNIDCLKFVSSATLFQLAATDASSAEHVQLTSAALIAMNSRGFPRCSATEALWGRWTRATPTS